jgi:hypothetical protein
MTGARPISRAAPSGADKASLHTLSADTLLRPRAEAFTANAQSGR